MSSPSSPSSPSPPAPELPAWATPGTGPPPAAAAQALLAAHEAMVGQLCQPGALAGWDRPVQRIDTHLSTLLVAGDRVFKLKKPVAFGFVDFSTAAARHDACEQELRLNRRTAARWYLGVVAVRQRDGGAVVDAPGGHAAPAPVLDWAVQMRHFDARQGLDRLADEGRLTRDHIDALAQAVARFHATLPPAPPGYGREAATRHWARSNLDELAPLLAGQPVLAATLAALQGWTEARGATLAPLMALRARTGHVREVHGDLHLANVVWAGGAPLLFDALEFNDSLRHTDTVGDLAFAFMDLLAHGLPRLAWRFISQVLEASGDHGALPLLAWWAVYRAAVRAKVALLAGGPQAPALAARYLGVAARLAGLPAPALPSASASESASPSASPAPAAAPGLPGLALAAPRLRLLLCAGLSGSGKSSVAALLAERVGAVRLRSDVERKRLHGLAPTARPAPSAGLYTLDANRRTYTRLGELAELALAAGVSVVVDAAALRRPERDALRALAAAQGAAFTLVWCQAPVPVLQARLSARLAAGDDASDATPAVLLQQQAVAEPPAADEAACTRLLDTDVPLAQLAERCEQLALVGDDCAG